MAAACAWTTGRRWPASSINCAPASPGGCCPLLSLAVAARSPAGGGCATGSRQQLHCLLLGQLGREGRLDWSRASLDSISVRAKRGLPDRPEPDRPRQAGSKYHLLVDRHGVPLAVALSAAILMTRCCWRRWSTPSRRSRGHAGGRVDPASAPPSCTWTRPTTTRAAASTAPAWHHAQDCPAWHRVQPAARPPPLRGGTVAGVAGGYRRLQVRYERRADVMLGFLDLACALICLKSPNRWPVGS